MLIITLKTRETVRIGESTVYVLGVYGRQVRLGIEAPKNVPIHRHPEHHFCHGETLIFFPIPRRKTKLGACITCRNVYVVTDDVAELISGYRYDDLCVLWNVNPKEKDREEIKTSISPSPQRPRTLWAELPDKVRVAIRHYND